MNKDDMPTQENRVFANNGEEPIKAAGHPAADPLNPYQPQNLWIDPSKIHASGAVKKILTTVPIRKPNKQEFFRVHPGEDYWRPVALLELDRYLYLVHPNMVPHLDPTDFYYAYLCLAISKGGTL